MPGATHYLPTTPPVRTFFNKVTMNRTAIMATLVVCFLGMNAFGQETSPEWHMEFVRSHRATFEQEWEYVFPNLQSIRWIIALRYPPELPWSKDVECK